MSVTRDIVKYVNDNTSFTVGTDLFLGYIPLDRTVGVAIAEVGGTENDTNMLRLHLHIVSVADDYFTAENNCYSVYNLLVFSNGFNLDSGYVFNCVPINTPTYIGLNEHQKVIVTCAIALYKEK
jgi:hypothetical protein